MNAPDYNLLQYASPAPYGFEIEPIPDETVFGLIVTAGILAGCTTYTQAYRRIIGNQEASPTRLLPSGVQMLIDYLPYRYHRNIDLLYYEHTALPYFRYFSDVKCTSIALELMKSRNETHATKAFELTSPRIKENKYLKYCDACATEQLKSHGRTTWLRSHQLPGVMVCHKHQTSLIDSAIPIGSKAPRPNLIQLPIPSGRSYKTTPWNKGEIWHKNSPDILIAQASHELLFADAPSLDQKKLRKIYQQALAIDFIVGLSKTPNDTKVALCLTYIMGRVVPSGPIAEFNQAYYDASISLAITRISRNSHPLNHLLIAGTLFESFTAFEQTICRKALSKYSQKINSRS